MRASSEKNVSGPSRTLPGPAAANTSPVTLYHWLVVILCSAGWLFDCMGQRIFVLSREPAFKELLGTAATDSDVRRWGGAATLLLMVGWATGGILFGMLSDRYGRVKTMLATLLAYTLFSGLSGFAHSPIEFLVWRFLFGLGVGGMFGSATTLVAESVPGSFRTTALGLMQSLSAFGTMLASALSLGISPGHENFWGKFSGWQVLCFAGVAPALLAIPIVLFLKEPDPWKQAKAAARNPSGRSVGSLRDLFGEARWCHNLVVGVCLGVAGMVGLWGIAFFSPELISTALKNRPLAAAEVVNPERLCSALKEAGSPAVRRVRDQLSPEMRAEISVWTAAAPVAPAMLEHLVQDLNRVIQHGALYDPEAFHGVELKKNTRNLVQITESADAPPDVRTLNRQLVEQLFPGCVKELQDSIDKLRSRGTMLQDVGAVLGMFAFTFAASYFTRRAAFLGSFLLCLGIVAFVFASLKTAADVYWMLPLLGFATLSPFAGYSIYFPEIFPTRLRGTGVGFCYNTVRYLAAPFPFMLGWLGTLMPFRTVAVLMCGIYIVGIAGLWWAPETKGKPLPED